MIPTVEKYLARCSAFENGGAGDITSFRRLVRRFWDRYGRVLPWRQTADPYAILVSEIMLQQTQVERVVAKYPLFLEAFPDFAALASAQLNQVMRLWKGMGYNRRAVALRLLAQRVAAEYGGVLPADVERLAGLPGIGRATACAICVYAFNQPLVFIETNVRAVFLHFFFRDRESVRDAELYPLVEKTLDRRNPREWYSALMDLGVAVKRVFGNPGRRSAHYAKQSPFEGSRRQARGTVLRILVDGPPLGAAALARRAGLEKEHLKKLLAELEREGFITKAGRRYAIP
jgi:A/G-specific adenine glycosylase